MLKKPVNKYRYFAELCLRHCKGNCVQVAERFLSALKLNPEDKLKVKKILKNILKSRKLDINPYYRENTRNGMDKERNY